VSESPADPRCPACRSADVHIATTTDWVVYYRCGACAEIWSVARDAPPRPPAGRPRADEEPSR
jgi:hypothetical protein